MSIHKTNDQDRDDLIERFRMALHIVERSPSDEAVGELRSAAAPILDRLRAEYRAAGNTDGDRTALFRWLRARLADRESAAKPPRLTRSLRPSPQLRGNAGHQD
jgi:hypothetical protein